MRVATGASTVVPTEPEVDRVSQIHAGKRSTERQVWISTTVRFITRR